MTILTVRCQAWTTWRARAERSSVVTPVEELEFRLPSGAQGEAGEECGPGAAGVDDAGQTIES
jgi:hypothetical protein